MKNRILLLVLLMAALAMTSRAQLFGRQQDAAEWSAKAEMKSGKSGVITITAKIAPKWHIYGLTVPKEAPVATEIKFACTGMRVEGKISAKPAPKVKHDEVFGADIAYWDSGEVTFTQPFRLTARSGAKCEITITYIGCSGFNCAPPKTEKITVTVP